MPWTIDFYESQRGERPVREFLDSLPEKARAKCTSYINLLRTQGVGLTGPYARKIDTDLWELRPESSGVEYRFFYFTFTGQRIVIVHAIAKKTQKLRRADIDLARFRVREMRERKDWRHGNI